MNSEKRSIHVGEFYIDDEIKDAVLAVLAGSRISEGKTTRQFEEAFAEYVGTRFAVAVNSGTSALLAGLYTLVQSEKFPNINPGKKVITSPVTYIATSNAIKLVGLEPVWVDIDPAAFTLNVEQVEKTIQEAPEEYCAILPVHLMGYPNDMNKLNTVAERYGLVTFEDSAQAHGSVYNGRKTGSLSLMSDFSFYIAHNIQAGELGAITLNDPHLYRLLKQIKANGRMCDCITCRRQEGDCPVLKKYENSPEDIDPRFTHNLMGYNFKTMDLITVIALTQVKKADEIFKKRSSHVSYLTSKLEKYSDIIQPALFDPNVSYLGYPLIIKDTNVITRKKLRSALLEKGIESRPLFGSIPTQQPSYASYKAEYEGKLPNADNVGLNGMYIGCHQYLTEDDMEYIAGAFDSILGAL